MTINEPDNPWDKTTQDRTLKNIQKDDGTWTDIIESTIEHLHDKYFLTDNPESDELIHQQIRNNLHLDPDITDDLPFTKQEIDIDISAMKNKKLPAGDNITKELVNVLNDIIPDTLVNLYNNCLETGYFPKLWKIADMVRLPKNRQMTKCPYAYFRHWVRF